MAIKTLNVIKRNFQTYSNSKLSSLIIVLGPIILVLIMGILLQNTSLQNVNAGVFFSGDGAFKDTFIQKLNQRSFTTTVEPSLEQCKKDVINEVNHVCIHFKKENLDNEYLPENYESYDVDLYVDFSKQRIVWNIINSINGVVEEEAYVARTSLINNIKSNAEGLSLKLDDIENRLDNALSLVRTLKERTILANNEINSLRTNVQSSKQSLEEIKNLGVLAEPYASNLNKIVSDLNTIETQLNTVQSNIILESEIDNIENNLLETKSSVNSLRQDLNQLKEANVDRLADPIVLRYYSTFDDGKENTVEERLQLLDYILPSFLIFFLAFCSLLVSTIIVVRERKSGAYIRNIVSVNNGLVFILGNLLTVLITVFIQIAIIVLIASLFLNINILLNLYSLLIISFISILIFSLMGIAIGYLFSSYESAVTASTSIALLFFIFSSSIVPSEMLPSMFSTIVKLFPLTLLETKMRITLIFGSTLNFSLFEILSLGSIFLISALATIIFYKGSREKEI